MTNSKFRIAWDMEPVIWNGPVQLAGEQKYSRSSADDIVDDSIVREIEKEGLIDRLYRQEES